MLGHLKDVYASNYCHLMTNANLNAQFPHSLFPRIFKKNIGLEMVEGLGQFPLKAFS
jgi:hypothetical protein